MPTCWLDSTYPVDPVILVQPAAHVPHLLVFQQMWNLSRPKLMSSFPTSSLDQLAPQSQVQPQVQLQRPQPHRLPQHHLTVLVVLWTIALTCAQLMFSRNAWNHARGAAQVCSSEQSFFFYIKCVLACLR